MIKKLNKRDVDLFESIYNKYESKQKISYEEYVILLATNDEIWFSLNNAVYQVDYGIQGITSMFVTEYANPKNVSERSEHFASIIDMLVNFKINGKTIKKIWDEIVF